MMEVMISWLLSEAGSGDICNSTEQSSTISQCHMNHVFILTYLKSLLITLTFPNPVTYVCHFLWLNFYVNSLILIVFIHSEITKLLLYYTKMCLSKWWGNFHSSGYIDYHSQKSSVLMQTDGLTVSSYAHMIWF